MHNVTARTGRRGWPFVASTVLVSALALLSPAASSSAPDAGGEFTQTRVAAFPSSASSKRKRLIAKAHVPIVLPRRFVSGRGPRYRDFSYYETRLERPDFGTVYLLAIEDMPHELGHVFDRNVFTVEDRAEVARVLKVKRMRPWFWGELGEDPETWMGLEPLEEVFANAYADCFLHPKRRNELRSWLKTKV